MSYAIAVTYTDDHSGSLVLPQHSGRVLIFNGESLLRVACHPSYPSNGCPFVKCIDMNGGTAGSRFAVTSDAGEADPDSETIFLQTAQPPGNHIGGQAPFGPLGSCEG